MSPKLEGIDHIHVYVPSRAKAAKWYEDVLGFTIVEPFRFWSEDERGPLTIEDPSGKIHLALFRRENFTPATAIAFGTGGKEFLEWKSYLEEQNLVDRLSDHKAAWSLYFRDPYDNSYEITTYQYSYVANELT
ncbi:MAG: VOC family protein [Emcibacter sp.]|nr:VOC family protein [Emcibacter sp.]